MTTPTYTVTDRRQFAGLLSTVRASRTLRTYGRLGAFGRSLITTNGTRVLFSAWTNKPPLNIHRGA